jgi:hypothetical protein
MFSRCRPLVCGTASGVFPLAPYSRARSPSPQAAPHASDAPHRRTARLHHRQCGSAGSRNSVTLDKSRLLVRVQLGRPRFRLAMLHVQPTQQRDQPGPVLIGDAAFFFDPGANLARCPRQCLGDQVQFVLLRIAEAARAAFVAKLARPSMPSSRYSRCQVRIVSSSRKSTPAIASQLIPSSSSSKALARQNLRQSRRAPPKTLATYCSAAPGARFGSRRCATHRRRRLNSPCRSCAYPMAVILAPAPYGVPQATSSPHLAASCACST